MPRIRSIKPDFFKSEDVSALPMRARLTWIGLWTQCDDHGRYKDSAKLLKGDLWSLDDTSLREIEEDLAVLAERGRIVRYEVDGKRYLAIVNWHAHQAINRPSKPKYPAPPAPMASPDQCALCATPSPNGSAPAAEVPGSGVAEPRGTVHAGIREDSMNPHGALTPGKEGKGRERKGGEARGDVREDPPAPTEPSPEPPLKCPEHLDDPNPPPCGPCGDARKARARWDIEQTRTAAAQRSRQAHEHAETKRLAVAACQLCDERGYLPSGRQCAHDPTRIASPAAAAARAAIRRPQHTTETADA